ncbi:MAG: hypothetical protein SCH70_10585 [Candidatus Methanoperedens sp.]|nr:hypothetical protein [Candidatus Methanoperedens sp.]
MIESTNCPVCNTDLLIEIRADFEGRTFEFPSGIEINFSEVHCGISNVWAKRDKFDTIKGYLYQKLSCQPVNRQNLVECLTHRCNLNEALAYDLIEEIKVELGVYERDNMIMFA